MVKKSKKKYRLLLSFTIFYTAIYSDSLWNNILHYPIFNYIRYILLGCMLIAFLYKFAITSNSKRQMITYLYLLIFLVYNFLFHNGMVLVPIVIFCLYVSYLNQREVIHAYALGLSLCVLLVIPFSLVGILPKSTSNNLLSYGFSNPNGLGEFVAIIFMSYLYLSWKRSKVWFLLLYIGAIYFNYSVLFDRTASICMIIFLLCYFLKYNIHSLNVIGWLSSFSPIILTIISLTLAFLYGKYDWIYDVDHWLAHRIYTWNYYLNIYGLHFIPNNIDFIKANDYQLSFYGKNIDVLLMGDFDGGYMYLLLRMGIINTITVLGILINYINKLRSRKLVALAILLLIFMLLAFTESPYLAPYGFFQSYLLVICFSHIVNGRL